MEHDPAVPLGDGGPFDPDALRQRYSAERARRLRSDGLGQYVEIAGRFAGFGDDPWADPGFTRDPLTDEVDVAIIGAGFGGLLTGARLRELGVRNLRLIDKAADVGGTWYWNRYPGIACDVESYVYLPLLEELGYLPTEKYVKGAEILAHCQAIARHYDLYRNACLQTEVTEIRWVPDDSRWLITTDRLPPPHRFRGHRPRRGDAEREVGGVRTLHARLLQPGGPGQRSAEPGQLLLRRPNRIRRHPGVLAGGGEPRRLDRHRPGTPVNTPLRIDGELVAGSAG